MIKTKADRMFQVIAHAVLLIFAVFCLFPILLLVVSSFSEDTALIRYGYTFFPKEWSLDAYRYLLDKGNQIIRAYGISILVTALGTTVSLSITTLLAYAISRPELPGRKAMTFFVFFTMLFNGGLVPTYLMYTGTFHIKNTLWALLIPNLLVRAYYVLLMKSFFMTNIPGEVVEAAQIDGASEMRTFLSVCLPMAKPILVTIGLFVGILYWNDWNNGFIYLTTRTELFSIQNLLNRMIQEIQFLSSNSDAGQTMDMSRIPSGTVRMAIAVVGFLPIALVYPFLQKNFTKGITLGAVKG